MKKFSFILFFTFIIASFGVNAQHNMIFRFKGEFLYGTEINSSDAKSMYGTEWSLELPEFGKKNWHYTYKFPTVGFAGGYMHLNGTDSVSHIVYTYPYFLYPFVHTPMVALNLRLAHGIGAFVDFPKSDRHAWTFPYVGVYSAGLTGDFHLGRKYGNPLNQWQLTLGGNLTWLHDGFINRHTLVMFIPYANVGLKYTPNVYALPMKHKARPVRHVLGLEAGIQGGINQLSRDNDEIYHPNASINVGLFYPFTNAYRMGLGLEGFFNDAYDGHQHLLDNRYNFIKENKLKNKIRGGIFWANDITIERFSAGVHIGVYPYNPIKVPDEDEWGNKLNNRMEDFLYWKLVTKYRFTKHFYCVSQLKLHMDAVEFFDMGFGYAMPDFGNRVKNPFARISFKKEDPNELKIEDETNTKKPFRFNELFDE